MADDFFREGGPHNIKRTGQGQVEMRISIPQDKEGLVGRSCPDNKCSPGYFKVKNGTGIIENQIEAFCPYCRRTAKPSDFVTQEQIRYGKDQVMHEVHEGIDRMIKNTFKIGPSNRRTYGKGGLVSMEVKYKPSRRLYAKWEVVFRV